MPRSGARRFRRGVVVHRVTHPRLERLVLSFRPSRQERRLIWPIARVP